MRTNIVIDDTLMRNALRASGLPTKKAAVEEGLRMLVLVKEQGTIRRLRGRVQWQGDLARMRSPRVKVG